MRLGLRTLLLGLTSLTIVAVEVGQAALHVREQIHTTQAAIAGQTQRLAAAGTPLLLNALVVGDLATAEQVLHHLNSGAVWRRVVLYEADGRHQILDASPPMPVRAQASRWLPTLLHLELPESRLEIAGGPRVYAVLAVTPSLRKLEGELWAGIRSTAVTTAVLLAVLLGLMNLILVRVLRPMQDLGRSAVRLGAGDLTARAPETGLVEFAATARAFNTMATNLEHAREAEEALHAAEEQLRQAQKMEAIGKLAGGVAHDFNNLLTVIIGRCGLLAARVDERSSIGRDLELVRATAERAAGLTRQLLAFGRKQVLQPRALDPNGVVEGIAPMLRRLIGEDVELTVRLRPDVGRIMADPSQIEQVIVNLAVNARDAMPRGGQLTIETAGVDLDAAYVRLHPGAHEGGHVMLAVSDTGTGMDAATRARIFEPFFTTKAPGEGNGLGLATVYGIVEQSGGTVWVYSEPQRGAVFKVYLPRIDAPVDDAKPVPAPLPPTAGTETILLVEDQQEVRELARDVLHEQGYTVLEAGDPEEAWRVLLAHRGRVDLLLTDVVMPRGSGRELADRLGESRPGVKVLYMSGYTDRAIVHHGVLEEGIAYLQKPFTVSGLVQKVRDVLDAADLRSIRTSSAGAPSSGAARP